MKECGLTLKDVAKGFPREEGGRGLTPQRVGTILYKQPWEMDPLQLHYLSGQLDCTIDYLKGEVSFPHAFEGTIAAPDLVKKYSGLQPDEQRAVSLLIKGLEALEFLDQPELTDYLSREDEYAAALDFYEWAYPAYQNDPELFRRAIDFYNEHDVELYLDYLENADRYEEALEYYERESHS